MNGSRPTPTRHGERSSLDALNRTIEGLEARIEGLIGGPARDSRPPAGDTREALRRQEPRQQPAPAYRARPTASPAPTDPLSAIRERQRMLDAGRVRVGSEPLTETRPPEAYRPAARAEMRQPAVQAQSPAQTIAQTHAATSDSAMREIAQALVSLRMELKQDISEGVAREMNTLRGEIRSIKTIAEDQHFSQDVRGDLARLAEGIDQLGHQATPEAANLRAEFEDLRLFMDGLARETSMQRMETRWQGLEERMQDLDSSAVREDLLALAYRIDDVKGQLGAMNDTSAIQSLEQKLITVASAVEQLGIHMQPNDTIFADQFATLDERLDEISRAIAASSRASAAATIDKSLLQRLDGRIGSLADQIEGLTLAAAAQAQIDPTEILSERIEALTGRIEELADEHAAMRLEERLEQLSHILQQAQQPVHQELSNYLADISRKIDGLDNGSVNDALAERLDYLARRFDEIDHQPRLQPVLEEAAFVRIEDRLSDIAARLDEATSAPRGDEEALRGLEEQISQLSTLISQPRDGGGSTFSPEFETRMAAIEGYMATNDEYIIEAARQAAEAVVEAYSRNAAAGATLGAADMAALAGLAEDLRHLEDLTRGSDQRSQQTFEALHGTLVQIADRLDSMEDRFSGPADDVGQAQTAWQPAASNQQSDRQQPLRMEALKQTVAMPAVSSSELLDYDDLPRNLTASEGRGAGRQPAVSYADEDVMAETLAQPAAMADEDETNAVSVEAPAVVSEGKPAKPSLLSGLSRRFRPAPKEEQTETGRTLVEPAPSIDPSDMLPSERENDLLEPGSGAPDVKKILERVRASQAAGDFDGDKASAGGERADYIAAARRAAKAAAQETDPSQTLSVKSVRRADKPAKVGSGKSLGATISQHRRPIMIAVGAILLALMAVPIVKSLTSERTEPQPAAIEAPVTAPVETPTSQAPAELPPLADVSNSAAAPGAETEIATPDVSTPDLPAADSAETGTDGTDANPADVAPASPVNGAASSHLTDPRMTDGQAFAIAPSAELAPSRDAFVAAPAAEVATTIVVPQTIQPKSLADAASGGDAAALFEIGARFTDGRDVAADLSEAATWYKLAADRGLAPAQYRLANLFEKGTGVERDLGQAMRYYRLAADAGNASAMHNLAVLFASGAQGQPNYPAAVEWFGKAAELGVSDSQFNLAILYARGNGAPQNLEESYKWFAVAAKGGDTDAAQKRDEVANAMRKEQLDSARAKTEQWKPQTLDANANSVNLPDEWASGKPLTTASVDMGKAIRNIQAILNKNGFDAGTPDGKIGAKTTSAIKAFQSSVGQEPSGRINDALVKELLARNK